MNTHLIAIKDKVSTLLEKDEGTLSLKDLQAGLRAKLSAFEAKQARDENRKAFVGRTASDLGTRVNELEGESKYTTALKTELADVRKMISAKRCVTGFWTFMPHGFKSILQADGRSTRTMTTPIFFRKPFVALPKVIAGFSTLDAANTANLRVTATITNLNESGFDLSVYEWSDSHNYRVTVSWMACTP